MATIRLLDIDSASDIDSEFQLIGCDPMGAKLMVQKGQFRLLKVEGLKSPAANILKQEMLSVGGEAAVARSAANCSAPTSDVLIMGTVRQIHRVLPKLRMEPFGLKALADQIVQLLAWSAKTTTEWHCRDRVVELGRRTVVMGVINVTPDSFSGNGLGHNIPAAVTEAKAMLEAGAEIIDIGGESTRPGSDSVSEQEEISRVLPVVKALAAETNALISVDTMKSRVASAALAGGAHIINDVTGLTFDPKIAEVCAEYGAGVVIMHIKGTPKNMQENPTYEDLLGEVAAFLSRQAHLAIESGISPNAIVIDPGIGFGKTGDHNLELIRRLRELRSIGYPLLLGTSRKGFIGRILDAPPDQRVEGTGATVAIGIANGADIVRVHDVEPIAKVVKVADAIVRR